MSNQKRPVAIVTGGAGGMGLATARLLGRDHHVIVSDVNEASLEKAALELASLGISSQTFACDITRRDSVEALFKVARDAGTIHSVVHTAGVSPQMGAPELIIRINALGTVHVTEAALAVAHEHFALVNVASIAAHMMPRLLIPRRFYKLAFTDPARMVAKLTAASSFNPRARRAGAAYSLSKNFVVWYSAKMAAAFGEKGARILSVSPGTFDTSMGRLEEKSGSAALLASAALKRSGRPEEIAELLAFCAGSKPGYLTGVDILCDGGVKAGLNLKALLAMARA